MRRLKLCVFYFGFKPIFLAAVITVILSGGAFCDVFSSSTSMETLLRTEEKVGQFILRQIDAEIDRLSLLKSIVEGYRVTNQNDLENSAHLNPINAYLLIKRLIYDWHLLQDQIRAFSPETFIQKILIQRKILNSDYPDMNDLTMAGQGLMKLQDTYGLTSSQISTGTIPGVANSRKLSAKDCFNLGFLAYEKRDLYHAVLWFQEALRRFPEETNSYDPELTEAKILEFLAYVSYYQNSYERAVIYYRRLIELQPDHPIAYGNLHHFVNEIRTRGMQVPRPRATAEEFPLVNPRPDQGWLPKRETYEALCRGDYRLSESLKKNLFCFYKTDHVYLKLARMKVEKLFADPEIYILRNFVSPEEIEIIKSLAKPKLSRATVFDIETGGKTADYRTSKTMWLKDHDHPVVERIHKRIGMFSNLNMQTSEDLQVNNYGLAGHYDPHFDYSNPESEGMDAFGHLGTGNRIATFMIYLEAPENGGATVFPELHLSVFAETGDAVFWWNLMKSGDGDIRSLHAGCPVLSGEKWVANTWFHERGQEFTRPCGLNLNE